MIMAIFDEQLLVIYRIRIFLINTCDVVMVLIFVLLFNIIVALFTVIDCLLKIRVLINPQAASCP